MPCSSRRGWLSLLPRPWTGQDFTSITSSTINRSTDLRQLTPLAVAALLAGHLLTSSPALGNTNAPSETDALDLKSAPEEVAASTPSSTRFFIEGAVGRISQRYGAADQNLGRGSIDLVYTARLGAGWRAVLSNRIDVVSPVDAGASHTTNSLREAYASWASDGGASVVEFGRINLRNGPAYGYNPTDFFRDGALRVATSANPFALRDNRLGTVMLRGQVLWQGGSVSLALAPKVANRSSDASFSLDLGATNNRSRALLTLSQQWSDRISGQLLFYKDDRLDVQPAANLTWLVSDAVVAHAEWAYAKGPSLADVAWQTGRSNQTGSRMAAGLTYTTASKLSLTVEGQSNELALRNVDWNRALAANPSLLGLYLTEADRRQDLASRRAVLIYATQRDLGVKNLDLTALIRSNLDDQSRMVWLELRYHWSDVDLALQWHVNSGRTGSEYALLAERRVVQVVGTYHFK